MHDCGRDANHEWFILLEREFSVVSEKIKNILKKKNIFSMNKIIKSK